MPQDFSKGKIYKITNDYNDKIYVGSTCESLVKRFSKHKAKSKLEEVKHYPLYVLMHEIGFDRFRIELLEDCPCEDKYQLRQKEGQYIREMGTLNKIIAGRTIKEWEEDNKEKKREYEKQYLSIPENRQKHNEYHLKRYHEKKDEINARRNAKPKPNITCECGAVIQNVELRRHKKSIKHLEAIKNIYLI